MGKSVRMKRVTRKQGCPLFTENFKQSSKSVSNNTVPISDPQFTTYANLKRREFISMKYGPLFIYGVTAGNSSEKNKWDVFKIYGALYKPLYGESKLTCCLKFTDGNRVLYKTVTSSQKYFHVLKPNVTRFHLTCPNVTHHKGRVPNGVAVTIDNKTCSESDVTYVEPFFPLREPNKIALSPKTVYGTIDAEIIIEWMEAYKYLGVDKVVSYYMDSINNDALKVLKYYASTGILDLYFFEPAYESNCHF